MSDLLGEQIEHIFVEIFNLDNTIDVRQLTIQDLEDWDSVTHMLLIDKVESVFQVVLDPDDIADMISYKNIFEIITKKYLI